MTPSQDPILAAFAALLERRSTATLVVRDERRASAADIDDLARSCVDLLAAERLEEGQIVALQTANVPGFLAALLAVRRIGCAALLLDGSTPGEERTRIVRRTGARGILLCPGSWPDGGRPYRFVPPTPLEGPPSNVGPSIAVLKLTSGSTGRPQGILTSAEALVTDEAQLAATMGIGDDERILAAVPLSHSYGLSSVAMAALVRGATIVAPDESNPMSPMITAERQGVTFIPSVPAHLGPLVKLSAPPSLPSTVRRVVSAGAPLPPATARRFRKIFGRPIQVFYGSSECGGICYDRDGSAGEAGSVGTPVDGVSVTLDRDGAVVVESAAVAQAYFPVSDPSLVDGVFRSPDLGRWDDGRLTLVGRIDDLINIRGNNVNPREVEEVLGGVDGVDEVAALGIPAVNGDGEMLRAVVACTPGSFDEATLRSWCRQHLVDYKVPRSLVLVERLPRTERGKLDREALRSLSCAGRSGS